MSVTECYQHKIVNRSNLNSFSLSLASALHQFANSTTLIASALVLKFSAFFLIHMGGFWIFFSTCNPDFLLYHLLNFSYFKTWGNVLTKKEHKSVIFKVNLFRRLIFHFLKYLNDLIVGNFSNEVNKSSWKIYNFQLRNCAKRFTQTAK